VRKNYPGEQLSISRLDGKTSSIAEFDVLGGQISHLVLGDVEVIPEFTGENARAQVFGYTMAPWPNRLEDGKYRMAGTDYQTPKLDSQNNANHGLLLDEKMEILSHASDSLKLSYSFGQDAHYPFAIDLEIEFILEENALVTRATATNNSTHAAPFAIGFHPYFLMGSKFTVSADFTHQIVTDGRMLPVSAKEVSGLDLNQNSLELATLDQILDELRSRYDCVILATRDSIGETQEYNFRGDFTQVVGLVQRMLWTFQKHGDEDV